MDKWQCIWLHPVSPVVGFALDTHHFVKPNGKVKGDDPDGLVVYGGRSAFTRLLGSLVRFPREHVSCVCFVGSGLCQELIARPEESYGLRVCLIVCDL